MWHRCESGTKEVLCGDKQLPKEESKCCGKIANPRDVF